MSENKKGPDDSAVAAMCGIIGLGLILWVVENFFKVIVPTVWYVVRLALISGVVAGVFGYGTFMRTAFGGLSIRRGRAMQWMSVLVAMAATLFLGVDWAAADPLARLGPLAIWFGLGVVIAWALATVAVWIADDVFERRYPERARSLRTIDITPSSIDVRPPAPALPPRERARLEARKRDGSR